MEDEEDISSQAPSEFSGAIEEAASNFDSSLKASFTLPEYKKLRVIGAFLSDGLSQEESCILARIAPERLTELIKTNVNVAAFIRFKEVAYKAKLMRTLSFSAIEGRQAKSAGYLLEQKFPSDFNKKKDPTDRPADMFEDAIRFVRENGDSTPVVKLPAPHARP